MQTRPTQIRLADGARESRVAAIRLATATLRCMENWRKAAGGYDEAMVLIAVVAITSEKLTRGDLSAEYKNLSKRIPRQQLTKCSVASIADAIGLNRETTRRKVKQLISEGFLMRDDVVGIRLCREALSEETILELIGAQLDTVRKAAESFVRDGIFVISQR